MKQVGMDLKTLVYRTLLLVRALKVGSNSNRFNAKRLYRIKGYVYLLYVSNI